MFSEASSVHGGGGSWLPSMHHRLHDREGVHPEGGNAKLVDHGMLESYN